MARQIKGQIYLRGDIYWLCYQVHGKRFQQSLKVTTEREAIKERDKIIHPLRVKDDAERLKSVQLALSDAETVAKEYDQQQIEKNRHKIKLAEVWDEYHKDKTRPQSGDIQLAEYKRFWDKFAEWVKTNCPDKLYMEDVTPQDAEDFLNYLENETVIRFGRIPKKKDDKPEDNEKPAKVKEVKVKGYGANRYNKYLCGLKLIFKVLAEKCNNMVNPFSKFKRKALETLHHRALTEEELMKVCQGAEGELKLLLAIGLYTGFRISDASLLKWSNINVSAGYILKKTKKTGEPVKIPFHADLSKMFQEIPVKERKEYVLPGMAESYLNDGGASIAKQIRKHFVSCGIETNRDEGRAKKTALVTFHSLRHTLINLMAQKGVSLVTVRQIAGHRSEEVQRAYIHEDSGAVQNAINLLPSISGNEVIEANVIGRTEKERIQEALKYIEGNKKISGAIKKELIDILSE